MGDKGKRDKGKREQQKKAQLSPKAGRWSSTGVYVESACANKLHTRSDCQTGVTKVMAGKVNNASNPDVTTALDMTTGELRRWK